MTEPAKESPLQSKSTNDFPDRIKAANLLPTSNVHVVEPGHLADDASRGYKVHRSLIILLSLLGLAFVAGFIFLAGWYYVAVYSKPKVIATECFELSLPGFYNLDTSKNNDVDMSKACFINQAAFGRGGVSAVQQKNPVDTSKQSLEEYTQKVLKIQTAVGASTGQLESREQMKLDGVEAWREVHLDKDGMRNIQYHGVRDGKFFIVGWIYNTANPQAKSDIEKSIASFRWK